MNSMKRKNDRTLKDELARSVGARYATGDQWRNNSRRNEWIEPKQKQHPVVDVNGDRSKVRCCKEQYCIGTWNVPLILGISKQNELGWVNLTQMTIISTTVGRNPLEEME